MTRVFHAVALAVALFCCACSSAYDYSQQEILVRVQAKEDTLLILEVQTGLDSSPKKIDDAVSALTSVLRGAKRFPPELGFISFDLDTPKDENWSEIERADFTEFAANVHVEEAALFRDEHGQLCFVRRTRIDHLRRTLEITNAFINRLVLEERDRNAGTGHAFQPEFPFYDEATRDAVHAAATSGQAWLSVRDNELAVDYPMSEAVAARCLSELALGTLHKDFALILAQVSSLRVADGRVLLRFGEPHKPVLQFSKQRGNPLEPTVDEDLMAAIQKSGLSIGDAVAMKRMRTGFESGPVSAPLPK